MASTKTITLPDLINKTCIIGLTYSAANGDILKQTQLSGTVIEADAEEGISIQLTATDNLQQTETEKPAIFHLPPSLKAWFVAPDGDYKNTEHNININNPDYFVTWDIIKKKDDTPEGIHEWWEWHPRTNEPTFN